MVNSMQDKDVSLNGLATAGLWTSAAVLVPLDVLTDVNTGDLGILSAIGAATLSIRSYFAALEDRERNAFEIGRDSVRHRGER